MMAKLEVHKVLSLFDDDPVAKQMIVEKLTGARAEELQASRGSNKGTEIKKVQEDPTLPP